MRGYQQGISIAIQQEELQQPEDLVSKEVERIELTIDLDERLDLHKAMWQTQRVFLVLVSLVIVLGFAGLFGDGWLSQTSRSESGIKFEYPYFARFGNETAMSIQGPVEEVRIPASYLRQFKLSQVVPQPEKQSLTEDGIVLRFGAQANGTVHFFWLPTKHGPVVAGFEVNEQSFDINQFTYP